MNVGELSKPFPYFPPKPSEREMTRMELMMELNKWDNNNEMIARKTAAILIELLQVQFAEKTGK